MRNRTRGVLSVILAVCLLLGVSASLAEGQYNVSLREICKWGNIHLGTDSVFMIMKDDAWILMDEQGQEIGGPSVEELWGNEAAPGKGFLVMGIVDEKKKMGLLWEDGEMWMPAVYDYIVCYDEHWAGGKTSAGYDIYYDGARIMSYQIGDIMGQFYPDACAYGSYLYISKNPDGLICLDRNGNTKEYGADALYSRFEEFEYDWKTDSMFHPGSGQTAFASSCTLSAEDVTEPYLIVDRYVLDLQGNIVGNKPDEGRFDSGSGITFSQYTWIFSPEGKRGIADPTGKVILPPVYDEISQKEPNDMGLWTVRKDGTVQFVDRQGQTIQSMNYSGLTTDIHGWGSPFLIFDSMGDKVVFTAGAGLLPNRFEGGYQFSSSQGCIIPFSVKEPEGYRFGIMDINGNILLTSTDRINLSKDGSLVHAKVAPREYILYRVVCE